MSPFPLELAQAAYAAYGEFTGGKNYRGEPMPVWEDLGQPIQHAWVAAAGAVYQAVVTPPSSRPSRFARGGLVSMNAPPPVGTTETGPPADYNG